MNFLQDVAKEIGNEYAGLVSDGVAAGDTSGFIDTGSYIFNALVSVQSTVASLEIRLPLLQESRLLARLSFVSALSSIFSIPILTLV